MSTTGTPAAPATLRTTGGREAARWVAAHCRDTPWLTAATAVSTVAGAALHQHALEPDQHAEHRHAPENRDHPAERGRVGH
ncbi:hypothetical protein ACWC5I_14685, partial [Kitasatospora sp. NPDC001574]